MEKGFVTHTLRIFTILTALLLASRPAIASVHLDLDVENVHVDTVDSLCPVNSTVVLLVSTANSSFGDLAFSNNPALADTRFTAEADDRVLGMFEVQVDGAFRGAVDFNIDSAVTPNDPLLLVWYPDLPYDPSRQGPGKGQRFGTYRSDAATEWSDIGWRVPPDGSSVNLVAFSVSTGIGDVPDASLVANFFTAGQANRPPTAVCQNVTKAADTNCMASVDAAEVDSGSSDPDGDPITLSLSPTGPFGLGTNNVTLSVADNQGATNTCSATITVVDTTPPTITCASNISTQIPPAQTSVVINYPAPAASDACSSVNVVSVPPPGSSFLLGTNTVTCTATDGAGNTNSCSFKIIVIPKPATNSAPTAVCHDVTKAAGTNCMASVSAGEVDAGSSDPDADPITLTLSPAGPFAPGTNAVTLTVADNHGGTNSCSANVIVVDNTPPTITCPSNISTQVLPGVTTAAVNFPLPVASDTCSTASVVCVPPSGTSFPLGTNTVTCTATDAANNQSVCTFHVMVNSVPVALCHDVTKLVDTNCAADVTVDEVDNGSYDPEGDPITLSLSAAGAFGVGTNSVTLTVADNRGGTNSCNANVIVVDDTPPVITCPGNISTQVLPGVTSAVVNFPAPPASDNCSIASVVSVPPSGSAFLLGTNTVTCTATDAAGNTNSCSFDVIVSTADTNVYDLAVVGLRAPKTVKLSARQPNMTGLVRVTIQNFSPRAETITNLTGLVDLQVLALTNCPNLTPTLLGGAPQRTLPVTLKPKQKLNVYFQVTFSSGCIPNLRKSTRRVRYDDYRYVATVHHEAIAGKPDTNPSNDTWPVTGEVVTDVYVWFW